MDARSSRYHEVYARWQRDPQGFWAEAAADIDWFEKPKTTFDPKAGIYGRWFPGGVCNTCFNAVDRHVDAGRGDQAAIIYDSPLAGTKRTITYHRLLTETQVLGGHAARSRRRQGRPRHSLYADGAGSGDRDARLRPHRRRSFGGVRRLRRARTGDPHRRRQAESDPLRELRHRARPHRALQAAARRSDRARRAQARRLPDPAAAAGGSGADRRAATTTGRRCATTRSFTPARSTIACRSRRPIRSTFSTPRARPAGPKGVVRDNGGHMVALKWSMKNLYGVEPGEVWWTASDIGWVVGHSYIVYAPLLHGCTSILYEGKPVGTPDAGAFWRVISEHGARGAVHRADRVSRHQERRPARQALRAVRSVEIPHAVSGRRARRSADAGMGGRHCSRCR